jgi:hypothetical protein
VIRTRDRHGAADVKRSAGNDDERWGTLASGTFMPECSTDFCLGGLSLSEYLLTVAHKAAGLTYGKAALVRRVTKSKPD